MFKKIMCCPLLFLLAILTLLPAEAKPALEQEQAGAPKEVLTREDLPVKFLCLLDPREYPIWFGRSTDKSYKARTLLFLLTLLGLMVGYLYNSHYSDSSQEQGRPLLRAGAFILLLALIYNLIALFPFCRAAYLITNKRVIIKEGGFFSSGIYFLLLKDLSNLQIHQSFFDHQLFSVGTITFFTGAYQEVAVYHQGKLKTKTTQKKDKKGQLKTVKKEREQHTPLFSHYKKVPVTESIDSVEKPFHLYKLLRQLTQKA